MKIKKFSYPTVLNSNAVLPYIPVSYSGLRYCIGEAARRMLLLQQVPSPLRTNGRVVVTSGKERDRREVSAMFAY